MRPLYRVASAMLASVAAVAVALLLTTGAAQAATIDGWTANPGTKVVEHGGMNVLQMDTRDAAKTPAGTSLERIVAGNIQESLKIDLTLKLKDGATCGGGAPRVYLANGNLYGQLVSCPTAAAGNWQSVDFTDSTSVQWWSGGTQYASWSAAVAAHLGTPLGQVGLVSDNTSARGVMLFKGLKLAGKHVNLGQPSAAPSSSSASPKPSTSTSAKPPASSAAASTSPVHLGNQAPSLPVTGAKPLVLGAIGAAVVAAGVILVLVGRRNREAAFTAE